LRFLLVDADTPYDDARCDRRPGGRPQIHGQLGWIWLDRQLRAPLGSGIVGKGSMGEVMATMRRWAVALATCGFAAILLAAAPAQAQKRVALVVGNDRYANLPADKQLRNAVADARAVKTTLEGLGFDVLFGENLDRRALIDKMFDLAARLGKDDTAFFFFAGHGVSLSGANYLLPSDIPAPRATGRSEEGRLADQAIAETQVIERITGSGARVAIVVLDACRDNPLQASDRRSVGATRGFAPSQQSRGVFSIYSAGFGQAALDRLGPDDRHPNSVFTRVFTEKLKTPGADLKTVATETRRAVAAMAEGVGHEQFPAYYDQILGGDVYLAGQGVEPRREPTLPAPAPTPTSEAAQVWSVTRDTSSTAILEAFIRQFGDTAYGPLARARLEEVRKSQTAVVAPPASAPRAAPEPPASPAVGTAPAARTLEGSEVWVSWNPNGEATARRVIERLKSRGVRVLEDRKKANENESWDHDLDHDPKQAALASELTAVLGDIYPFTPKTQDGIGIPSLWITPKASVAPQPVTAPVPQGQFRTFRGAEVWVSWNPKGDPVARRVIARLKSLGVKVMEDRKDGNEGWDHDLDHDPKHAALVRELVAATGDIYRFTPKKQDGRSIPSLWITPR
jgi:uncharacterized caspase-like protein